MKNSIQTKSQGYERDQVVRIINSVIDKVQRTDFSAKDILFRELHDLKNVIEETRREIGSARPGEIRGVHIPAATDELDAVIGATAESTGAIMDSCEVIQKIMAEVPVDVVAAEAEITKIFEACSFQDITGQRITKVVRSLQTIEEKVGRILSVIENKMPGIDEGADGAARPERSGDERLLNGPQLPGNAISQADIDRLLAEFDN